MQNSRIFKLLNKVADYSAPVGNARIAASVVRKGEVISIGTNSYKSDPLQAKFSKNEHAIYLHAEISAIKKALKKVGVSDLKDCSLYVVRRKHKDGIMCDAMAKPCLGCQKAIESFGICNVFYTKDS